MGQVPHSLVHVSSDLFKTFFLKVFIKCATILLLFYVLVFWPRGMWDLGSPTRDQTRIWCIGRQSLDHCTAREVPRRLIESSFLLPYELGISILSARLRHRS